MGGENSSQNSTPEARTASDSLINQLREDRKALQEKTTALQKETLALRKDKKALQEKTTALQKETLALRKDKKALQEKTKALEEKTTALEEKTTALREDTKAFRVEKRALDSLIRLKYGKRRHLNSEEEDLSDLSILKKRTASPPLIFWSHWALLNYIKDLSALSDLFDGLTEDQKMSEEDRSVSPSDSCISMQSDRSKGDNPNFSNEPRPSGSNSSAEDSGIEDDD